MSIIKPSYILWTILFVIWYVLATINFLPEIPLMIGGEYSFIFLFNFFMWGMSTIFVAGSILGIVGKKLISVFNDWFNSLFKKEQ